MSEHNKHNRHRHVHASFQRDNIASRSSLQIVTKWQIHPAQAQVGATRSSNVGDSLRFLSSPEKEFSSAALHRVIHSFPRRKTQQGAASHTSSVQRMTTPLIWTVHDQTSPSPLGQGVGGIIANLKCFVFVRKKHAQQERTKRCHPD